MQKFIIALASTGIVAIFGAILALNLANTEPVPASEAIGGVENTIALTGLSKASQSAALMQANAYIITWETEGFDKSQKVDINLIEMISESPVIYKFIKKIAANTTNDGTESWIPETGELGPNSYIEVTCSNSISRNGCRIVGKPLAVIQ